jgi:hypothetical protein
VSVELAPFLKTEEGYSVGKVWVFDAQAGGRKIPPGTQCVVRERILKHAERNYAGKYTRIDVRFRGALCYIDAYREPHVGKDDPPACLGETREEFVERLRKTPKHLCRMRHFDIDRWSLAFYTYSYERYEPCVFPNGEWFGTPEEAFDVGAAYLE